MKEHIINQLIEYQRIYLQILYYYGFTNKPEKVTTVFEVEYPYEKISIMYNLSYKSIVENVITNL
jgi:hypothetical protein